jgi:hypothetical protein
MGRGRQKAKHTKVARELKYFSPNTDLTALEREIGHPEPAGSEPVYEDKWADLYPDDEDQDDEDQDDETPAADSATGSEDEQA